MQHFEKLDRIIQRQFRVRRPKGKKTERRDNRPLETVLNSSKKLVKAFKEGDIEGVKACLAENANPKSTTSENYFSLAHLACFQGWKEGLSLVAQYSGALEWFDKEERTPIFSAVCAGNIEMVCYLVEELEVNAFHLDSKGKTIFYHAIECKQHSVAEYLVREFPEMVDEQDFDCMTPLMRVVLDRNLEGVNKILRFYLVKA